MLPEKPDKDAYIIDVINRRRTNVTKTAWTSKIPFN